MDMYSPEQAAEEPASHIDDLLSLHKRLAKEVKESRADLESKQADLDAVNRTIDIIRASLSRSNNIGAAYLEEAPAPAPDRKARGAPRNRQVEADIDLTAVTVDFTGAEEIPESLIRIAQTVPNLYLNTTQVAKLLLRQGVALSNLHNTRVTVQRAFDGHPDLFRRVRAATYEYTGVPYVDELD